ncbi:hypothetical protein N783_04165 [Pontibacillus marinus BH030004 = DSM 16465]|uniref:Uncharacterized protein n=1 Tax=Pontibacillus marinus BH030004 = DSM 16465 TaxID=1385511 RepID=A0A0A5GF20_9BACI|nr:hypothetical protein N783_04165 [Pontibacillus marinus BH030004 = DSM 16465]
MLLWSAAGYVLVGRNSTPSGKRRNRVGDRIAQVSDGIARLDAEFPWPPCTASSHFISNPCLQQTRALTEQFNIKKHAAYSCMFFSKVI